MGVFKTIKEYSENCSVHGVAYIFETDKHALDRVLWIFAVLATFLSVEAYLAWGDFPLITSVSTTALPIEDLAWPSVTLCNQGRGLGAAKRVYNLQPENYLKEKGKDIKSLNDQEKIGNFY